MVLYCGTCWIRIWGSLLKIHFDSIFGRNLFQLEDWPMRPKHYRYHFVKRFDNRKKCNDYQILLINVLEDPASFRWTVDHSPKLRRPTSWRKLSSNWSDSYSEENGSYWWHHDITTSWRRDVTITTSFQHVLQTLPRILPAVKRDHVTPADRPWTLCNDLKRTHRPVNAHAAYVLFWFMNVTQRKRKWPHLSPKVKF